jgi:uncharacterized RDD family membrane protein YckC
MTAAAAYAPFGRRIAALAIDSVVLLAALVAIIVAANAALGPVLAAFWSAASPVRTHVEVASRTSDRQDDGRSRETVISRETRVFADGTVRIYLVAEARLIARDGTVSTTHVEDLIGRNARDLLRAWLTGALAFALSFVYFAGFEASAAQATPGKVFFGLKVAGLDGRRIGLGRSLFRQLMKCAEIASSGITYLIAAFTGRRQALHDMFAGTLVLQTASRPIASPRRAIAF